MIFSCGFAAVLALVPCMASAAAPAQDVYLGWKNSSKKNLVIVSGGPSPIINRGQDDGSVLTFWTDPIDPTNPKGRFSGKTDAEVDFPKNTSLYIRYERGRSGTFSKFLIIKEQGIKDGPSFRIHLHAEAGKAVQYAFTIPEGSPAFKVKDTNASKADPNKDTLVLTLVDK